MKSIDMIDTVEVDEKIDKIDKLEFAINQLVEFLRDLKEERINKIEVREDIEE